ncbi:flagellar basal body-associated FliL family protein [Flavimaricola marinus]|uniref:Flagellar protein FliL n=1 Tax=Flavimaricola marinus TaxID=1819565 RepID=A0A238LH56_9RHOB|nr:flagellar basal body-associated FliL family protein [Flavimaricola marinus]SMY08220.1 Flagellar FliL protein [Flavimaricola marinus]
MTAAADPAEAEEPKKKSKLPLILGVVLALVGGGGGFMAVKMGLLGGGGTETHAEDEAHLAELPPLAPASFVALDPLIVNMPNQSGRQFLRFAAQLEVAPEHAAEVEAVKPRIVDVLNGYLRAVEVSDLEDPTALMRLRAQMLRRVQVVTGEGRVRDLLIMEFVLN